ncbi:zinc finger protein 91-like isoform X2 [Zerene cesonia]|uniref:zinc finger protein 91-like isoform X2 n=1 Tax=Zerene cesonia TaxID=33412 RepID=UPI0018E5975F|nr:zinc finger protein 91-like isoform X2 [Zerene cesonia]
MEFDNIIVKENPGLCRCCLSEGCYKELGTEYPWMDETEVYADMLLECFDISISQHIEGPNGTNRLICEVCITRLRDACNFKKQVMDCEKKFVDMIGRGEFKQKALPIEGPNMKSEINLEEHTDVVTEIEYLEDGIDYDDDKDDPTQDITVETLPVKPKRGRPKKNAAKVEKKAKEEKPRTSKSTPKDENADGPCEHFTSERRRKNMQILFNSTTIMPFKWKGRFLCFYCAKDYTVYSEFKKHTKSHGLCTTKDYSLKIIKGSHIEIKLDISDMNCEICSEPFNSFDEIVNHLIGKHDMDYDKTIDIPFTEYRLVDMKCQFCGKEFSYFGYLISHLKLAHPQNNFICDDCGATFNMKRDLAAHLKYFHRAGGYPCEHCSEICHSHYDLKKHQNSYHFRRCTLCDSSFASYHLLQKHIQSEHAKVKNNKCPYCAKKCHSSLGVKLHIKTCKLKVTLKPQVPQPSENFIEPKKKQNILQIRQNILSVLNMSTVVPFKFFGKFSCFYCSIKFAEFDDLKTHTAVEHPVCDITSKCMKKCKGERTTVKVDISSLSCKLCCQSMDKLEVLIDHLISKHNAPYDKTMKSCFEPFRIVKDNIACMSCPSVFRYFATLLRHSNSEHSNNSRICDFCGRSFKNVTNLNVHISYAHTGACECAICGNQYKNQWCLNRHKAKCHNAKDFKCPNCPELFPSQYHRQKHLIKVHDIGHKCTYCGRMFTRNSFMKDHIRRTHLKEKNVECSICGEKFFDNYLLRMHMVKHEGVRKFSCDVCCKSFLRRSSNTDPTGDKQKKKEMVRKLLIKRRNIEYVLQYSNATPFLYYKARYRCFYCTEPMKDPDMLREHTLKMHQFANLELVIHDRTKNNRNWDAAVKIDICNLSCKLCPQMFKDLEQLIHHLIIAHDAEYDMSVPNCLLPFRLKKDHLTCPICDTKFVSFEYLLRHANKYHLSHDYICDVCGTSFQGVNHLRMHNRYYHKEGGYTCDYCGIKLETLSKKMLHEKNIHLVNLLTCPYCPEIFKSPYFKKLHLANVHGLADLKIKCRYCPKVFLQEGIMSRHMRRVHLRERNVECPICGDRFFGQYDVKLHMVKHNGDKKFICSVCGKMFGKRSNLNKHAHLHTGRKDYSCRMCGKEFAHRSNLRFHYKKKHPQYVEETAVVDENAFVNIELGMDFDVVEETV